MPNHVGPFRAEPSNPTYSSPIHNHFPYSLSFGYYLCTPDGSSPLIIEGKEIQVTEGRLIIFGGHQSHEVPDSDISGRCMIAGNIAYTGAIE